MANLPPRLWITMVLFLLPLSVMAVGCGSGATFEHEVQVQTSATGDPVAEAMVRAEIGVRDVFEAVSDSDGIARLAIDSKHLGGWAKVIIEAEGYKRQSLLVKLVEEGPPTVVELDSLTQEETPAEQPVSEEGTPAE